MINYPKLSFIAVKISKSSVSFSNSQIIIPPKLLSIIYLALYWIVSGSSYVMICLVSLLNKYGPLTLSSHERTQLPEAVV